MHKRYIYCVIFCLCFNAINAKGFDAGIIDSLTPEIVTIDDKGSPIITLMGHTDFVRCVSFLPGNEKVISGSDDSKIKIWDIKTGLCEKTFEEHTDFIQTITCSRDGKCFASGGNDYIINIVDMQTDICKTFRGHVSPVLGLKFSSDKKNFFSCASDATIRIWRLMDNNGICEKILKGHTGPVFRIKLSNDGKKIASCSTDNSARIWDIKSGLCEKIYRSPLGSVIQNICFNKDDSLLTASTSYNDIIVCNIADGESITLKGHAAWVNCVHFSLDGKKLSSSPDDNLIKIWDVATGKCLTTYKGHTQQILCMTFDVTGKMFASGSADKSIMIWKIP